MWCWGATRTRSRHPSIQLIHSSVWSVIVPSLACLPRYPINTRRCWEAPLAPPLTWPPSLARANRMPRRASPPPPPPPSPPPPTFALQDAVSVLAPPAPFGSCHVSKKSFHHAPSVSSGRPSFEFSLRRRPAHGVCRCGGCDASVANL
jgi:hypothetical protein